MKVNHFWILSTRELDKEIVEKAALQNIIIDTIDFIETKKMVTTEVAEEIKQLSTKKASVIFTSFNSVNAVAETLPPDAKPVWNIYTMAGTTFKLITRLFPFSHIISKASDAADLAGEIVNYNEEEITFFCGNKRREELPDLLHKENILLKELVVYETIETPVKITRDYDGILFFSPSAVNSFFGDNGVSDKTVFFAIGKTTANAVKQLCTNNIIVSDFPAKEKLAEKAIQFFVNKT